MMRSLGQSLSGQCNGGGVAQLAPLNWNSFSCAAATPPNPVTPTITPRSILFIAQAYARGADVSRVLAILHRLLQSEAARQSPPPPHPESPPQPVPPSVAKSPRPSVEPSNDESEKSP